MTWFRGPYRLGATLAAALVLALMPLGLVATMVSLRSGDGLDARSLSEPVVLLRAALPILMWLVALLVGWFVLHRLVAEPLAAISRHMLVYGQSSDPARTRMRLGNRDFGSIEFAGLASSFDGMADEIDRHSRDLRNALVEQQRLTREVHHRVKNNLQIISSMLSLHARAADTTVSSQAYAAIQSRLGALMHVHRWMYDGTTSGGVDLTALAGELCAGLEASLASPAHPEVTLDCRIGAAITLHPDAAVPVAFLITELATLAAQRGASGPLAIRITAAMEGRAARIAVQSAGFAGTDPLAATTATPAARIVHGMARQLRSALVHDPEARRYSFAFEGVVA